MANKPRITSHAFKLGGDVIDKGALFSSPDRSYRYKLWRVWDESKPKIMFLMMNPSCADVDFDDASVAKCGRFARMWGYGGLFIGNTFAFRATDQDDLVLEDGVDKVGGGNDRAILEMAAMSERIIMAYGKPKSPKLRQRGTELSRLLADNGYPLYALKILSDGTPGHPLYIAKDTVPVEFFPR